MSVLRSDVDDSGEPALFPPQSLAPPGAFIGRKRSKPFLRQPMVVLLGYLSESARGARRRSASVPPARTRSLDSRAESCRGFWTERAGSVHTASDRGLDGLSATRAPRWRGPEIGCRGSTFRLWASGAPRGLLVRDGPCAGGYRWHLLRGFATEGRRCMLAP